MRKFWIPVTGLAACLAGCSSEPAVTRDPTGQPAVLRLTGVVPLGVVLDAKAPIQRGTVPSDTAVRLMVRARERTDADARLCGVIASRSRAQVVLPWGWPVDSAAPRLALRFITEGDVQGVRFVVPGADARYVFEGVTRDGARQVSVAWPVTAGPIAVGAADSVIEAVLMPSPLTLDSIVRALSLGDAVIPPLPAASADSVVAPPQAVLNVRPLPVYEAHLSPACPVATMAIPSVARVDQLVKMPVDSGDVITADALVTDGAVRLGFDEAGPIPETRDRQSFPHASIVATTTGVLTLRVRVIVLPKVQAFQQVVYLKLQKSR